ncbi:hypothetical protein SAMN02745751_01604 [Dethiosulfatibacter aminovorans DSM 17477]|uniref:Uncharacterized protein n=1 Tax=Dethiosulfatibacter aminovorans DSM 17477 TaxID=1121476 RepID=A0A1M6FZQ3_9FIRM|nr:hypothetical protein [Dethiosulfatibacter aminovorans]SHJ03211.1 hypothetical protein SAMN02745751_01604 [Dethiosulfatibacter aminovorans DSM 17477]
MENRKWHKEINGEEQKLILTDDIDSLLSCAILNQLFNIQVGGFFSWETLYLTKEHAWLDPIYIDCDLSKGKCFGNHFTVIENPEAMNMNTIRKIKRNGYCRKYPFSTTLLILSLYNIDLSNMTDEQLKILIAIDSAYQGFYTKNEYFKSIWINWAKSMKLDIFIDLLERTNKSEFQDINVKYNLKAKLRIRDDKLIGTSLKVREIQKIFPDINLSVNLKGLEFEEEFKTIPYEGYPDQKENIFQGAWTKKNYAKWSVLA